MAIIVGIVFFLLGLPEFKKSPKLTKEAVKDIIYIFLTLLILLIFVVIISWNIRTSSVLSFSGPLTSEMQFYWGRKVLIIGLLEAAWFFISIKWLLPIVFDRVDLSKKQSIFVISGILLSEISGIYAMLGAS
ncbi:hypothetical protein [Paenibacillus sp. 8b26]|uniref:hypothetical protein n=1 Tax=Paenibacillus sp. 8b26 TaxID=3424133 RepID=UPI003D6530DC